MQDHVRRLRLLVELSVPRLLALSDEATSARQAYQTAQWRELVGLWRALNRRPARVMEAAPELTRLRSRADHDLDVIAWRAVSHSDKAAGRRGRSRRGG